MTTDTVADMRLDSRAYYDFDEEAEEEDEDEDEDGDEDDSASVYQDSSSLTPPPLRSAISQKASSKPHLQTPTSDPTNTTTPGITPSSPSGSFPNTTATTAAPGGLPPPNKRGRKPAPASSRGAREQARKTNHSRIEKRRREKINDALATLREVVPIGIAEILEQLEQANPGASPALSAVGAAAAAALTAASGGSIDGVNEKGKKKAGVEKEFKLEVLERTVVFVKYLLERVDELEAQVNLNRTPSTAISLNVCLFPYPFFTLQCAKCSRDSLLTEWNGYAI